MKRHLWTMALLVISLSVFAVEIEPDELPEAVQTIKKLGGSFRRGYTLNPTALLDIGAEWRGGNDGFTNLKGLQNVKYLTICSDALNEDVLSVLATMPDLTILNIERMKISDTGLKHLHTLKQLRSLSFSQCSVSDIQLFNMSALENITVSYMPAVKTLVVKDMPRLSCLRVENESKRQSGKAQVVEFSFSSVPKLEELYFSRVHVESFRFEDVPMLKKLTLTDANWPASAIEGLSTLTHLEEFKIHSFPLTENQCEVIKRMTKLKSFSSYHSNLLPRSIIVRQ
ncbi:MAG: hypothetical protein WCT04_23140 [Planctomycetota bacterium]